MKHPIQEMLDDLRRELVVIVDTLSGVGTAPEFDRCTDAKDKLAQLHAKLGSYEATLPRTKVELGETGRTAMVSVGDWQLIAVDICSQGVLELRIPEPCCGDRCEYEIVEGPVEDRRGL